MVLGLYASLTKAQPELYNRCDCYRYSARPGRERSGAYLFLPDSEGENLRFQNPLTLVFYGPIMSKVFVQLPNVQHSVILYNSPGKKQNYYILTKCVNFIICLV